MSNFINPDDLMKTEPVNVCRFCGESIGDKLDPEKDCEATDVGEHQIQEISPTKTIKSWTYYCELCGKEWSPEVEKCRLTKDGRHQYRLVPKNYVAEPIADYTILKLKGVEFWQDELRRLGIK